MIIETHLLDQLHENLQTIARHIAEDAIAGDENAREAHWRITAADEVIEEWRGEQFTKDEFFDVLDTLDKAIDATAQYDEEVAPSLIVMRYYMERMPREVGT